MNIEFSFDIFTQQRYGGVGRYFSDLYLELSRLGVEPVLSVPLARFREMPLSAQRSWRIIPSRLDRRGASVPLYLAARASEALRHRVLRSKPAVDIFHWTNYSKREAPRKVRQVVTVYDMIHEDYPHLFPERHYVHAKRRSVERADAIIAISQHTADRLVHWFPTVASKVEVIHLGIEPPQTMIESSDRRDFLLYVGTRDRHKNFATAARAYAMSELPKAGIEMRLFGGPPLSKTELEMLAALGILRNVEWTVGDRTMLSVSYRSALGLIYPSLCEGFGLPPLEAMALGCPVVASTGGSIPEVVGDAALTFDPQDVEQAVEHLNTLLDPTERSRLAAAGRKQGAEFSTAVTARKTLDLYGRLA